MTFEAVQVPLRLHGRTLRFYNLITSCSDLAILNCRHRSPAAVASADRGGGGGIGRTVGGADDEKRQTLNDFERIAVGAAAILRLWAVARAVITLHCRDGLHRGGLGFYNLITP